MKKTLWKICLIAMAAMMLVGCAAGGAAPAAAPAVTDTPVEADITPDGAPSEPEGDGMLTGVTDDGDMLVNPLTLYNSYAELLAALPDGMMLADAPEGSADVTYTTIDGEQFIAQIDFTYADDTYNYRCAACDSKEAQVDISGVYDELTKSASLTNEDNITHGGEYTLNFSPDNSVGLATWYYPATKCQYSLFTPTGCNDFQKIEELIDMLLPLEFDADGNPLVFDSDAPATPAATGEVSGVVQGVSVNSITITAADTGNTFVFYLTYIDNVDAKSGDVATIAYAGDVVAGAEAITITVTSSAPEAKNVSGAVTQFDKNSVYVKTSSGNVFGFKLDSGTKYTGVAKSLTVGNAVTVTYSGELTNIPAALTIDTITVASGGSSGGGSTPDVKTLTGYVTKLASKSITILADNGYTYTFKRNSSTTVSGRYTLALTCTVEVSYKGVASKSPAAIDITVKAPADPTPAKPTPTPVPTTLKTITGTISMHSGNALTVVTDRSLVYSFLIGNCSISGDSNGYVGDYATVTFYESGASYVPTSIIFKSSYVPPVVIVTPVPQPIYETRTVSGTVAMHSGNALSIVTRNGSEYDFLLGSVHISGNSDGEIGDEATVTFIDYGSYYEVTKVHFTAAQITDPIIFDPTKDLAG